MRWRPAYIGIGSNLDDPIVQVTQAIAELADVPDSFFCGVSSLYRSSPMGSVEQPDYINAVAALVTRLEPKELLQNLREIEDKHDRRRTGERWGPRTLDLDLLAFSDVVTSDEVLTLPHPGIAERNFVLLPLCELAPHLEIPGLGSVVALVNAVPGIGDDLEKLG